MDPYGYLLEEMGEPGEDLRNASFMSHNPNFNPYPNPRRCLPFRNYPIRRHAYFPRRRERPSPFTAASACRDRPSPFTAASAKEKYKDPRRPPPPPPKVSVPNFNSVRLREPDLLEAATGSGLDFAKPSWWGESGYDLPPPCRGL